MFDEILIFGVLGILSGLLAGMFGIGGNIWFNSLFKFKIYDTCI